MMSRRQILLINDMAGYGKVATAAMLPVLSYMGHPTFNLPTALVSNTLDYGKFNILDTTDYIAGTLPVWKELGFSFDAISTGFIVSERQARLIASYCKEQAARGTLIFVDPIMADWGKLYNGIGPGTVESMKEMLTVADLAFPNYTEACFLTGTPYRKEGVSQGEIGQIIDALRKEGCKSVLVTSVTVDGQTSVAGFSHTTGEYFLLPYNEIPVVFPGTGDIFSAICIGHILNGEPLRSSARKAMDAVYRLIDLNKDATDRYCDIPLERCLNLI